MDTRNLVGRKFKDKRSGYIFRIIDLDIKECENLNKCNECISCGVRFRAKRKDNEAEFNGDVKVLYQKANPVRNNIRKLKE